MSENKKKFWVTVPYSETVFGREHYTVEAESPEQAIELVRSGVVYGQDTVIEGAMDDSFNPYFDEAEVEEVGDE